MLRYHPSNTPAAGSLLAPSGRRSFWATASIDSAADTSPMELSVLGAHVDRCNGSRGRWFGLQCTADALAAFLAPRLVTTLVVVAIAFGVGSLVV
jgi:hypothetical protein